MELVSLAEKEMSGTSVKDERHFWSRSLHSSSKIYVSGSLVQIGFCRDVVSNQLLNRTKVIQ